LRESAAGGRIRRATLALLDNTGAGDYDSPTEADAAIAAGLIDAGLTMDEALAMLLDSARGHDAIERKGERYGGGPMTAGCGTRSWTASRRGSCGKGADLAYLSVAEAVDLLVRSREPETITAVVREVSCATPSERWQPATSASRTAINDQPWRYRYHTVTARAGSVA
jgi:hypothetical protein